MSEDSHPAAEPAQHTLPVGSVVGGLEITGVIGEGGFGIVYLAFDPTLQRQVALKEYMPSTLASRSTTGLGVSVKSPRLQETFDAGLRSFVNEARLLAHFDHPALVKVHQFWQSNRTAYMVMPFYEGPTLKDHVRMLFAHDRPPNEATLRTWIEPLLDALAVMHAERCFHRDIAPDNILLTPRGPLLLDFGAARKVISDMTQALTVILKPGYAPIEQYGEAATMVQGPWTDLYALASVVYFCITGRSPITSVERMMGDPLPLLAALAAGRYSDAFLRAIDAALGVRPIDRPQSVAELRGLLNGTLPPLRQAPRGLLQSAADVEPPAVPWRADAVARPAAVPRTERLHQPTQAVPRPPPAVQAAATPATSPPATPPLATPAAAASVAPTVTPAVAGGSPPAANRRVAAAAPWVAAGVAVAALAVAFWALLQTRSAPAPAPVSSKVAPAAARAVEPVAALPANPSRPPVAVPTSPTRPPAAAPVVEAIAPARAAPKAELPAPRPARAQTVAKPAPAPMQDADAAFRPPPPARTAPAPDSAMPAAIPPAKAVATRPARCGELFEKGNKGTLTLEDATFLRQSCR